MGTIKGQIEFEEMTEVEEILEDLIIRLKYQVSTNVKRKTLTDLEELQESIFQQRKIYQQTKFTTLKNA